MLKSLRTQIGSGKDCYDIDKQHIQTSMKIKRQSEQEVPRSAKRNGLIDGTNCQSNEERVIFSYCCVLLTQQRVLGN